MGPRTGGERLPGLSDRSTDPPRRCEMIQQARPSSATERVERDLRTTRTTLAGRRVSGTPVSPRATLPGSGQLSGPVPVLISALSLHSSLSVQTTEKPVRASTRGVLTLDCG